MCLNNHYFIVDADSPEKACLQVSKHPGIIFWGDEDFRVKVLGCSDRNGSLFCETESDKELIGDFSIEELNRSIEEVFRELKDKEIYKMALQDLLDHDLDVKYLLHLYRTPTAIGKKLEWVLGVENVFDFYNELFQKMLTLSQIKENEQFNLFKHSYHEWDLTRKGITHLHREKVNGELYCVIAEVESTAHRRVFRPFPTFIFS